MYHVYMMESNHRLFTVPVSLFSPPVPWKIPMLKLRGQIENDDRDPSVRLSTLAPEARHGDAGLQNALTDR